jgi:hypothetical protein
MNKGLGLTWKAVLAAGLLATGSIAGEVTSPATTAAMAKDSTAAKANTEREMLKAKGQLALKARRVSEKARSEEVVKALKKHLEREAAAREAAKRVPSEERVFVTNEKSPSEKAEIRTGQ